MSEYRDRMETAFPDRVGLIDGSGRALAETKEVVLAWPYKDCVLEGGKEDEAREIFWNVTRAPDEIARLFAPKVLTGFERWDAEAVAAGNPKPVDAIADTDNLLIRGDNLLALHSLKARYAGQVQSIYIDPPYNTGTGAFRYNDRFDHAVWLTFMRNRLEAARELLAPSGSLFVNIDFNEAHYLKVLADEVFGRENFQREIIWRIGWLSGFKTAAKNFIRNHDTILFYSRDGGALKFSKQYIAREDFLPRFDDRQQKRVVARLEALGVGKADAQAFVKEVNHLDMPERYPVDDVWNASVYDKLNSVAIVSWSGETVSKMLGVEEVKGQKSEALLRRIIESSTDPGDLVLDFFAGTGTTCAVAQKLGRRWIGVEQLDYVETTTKARLKKVLAGDTIGISRAVGWEGGGSFVYCELKEWNALPARIRAAGDEKALAAIVAAIGANGYWRYAADHTLFDWDAFADLPFDERKHILTESLEANRLYVDFGDMEEGAYDVGDEDVRLTRSFYGR
jgi:adenine-specific DNA-methyltransferase